MTTEALTETVSEKRGRGRPRLFDPGLVDTLGRIHVDVRTHRGLTNKVYGARGLRAVLDIPGSEWLTGGAGARKPEGGILSELGRWLSVGIPLDNVQRQAAAIIEGKHSGNATVRELRKARLKWQGKQPKAQTSALQRAWDKASLEECDALVNDNPWLRELVELWIEEHGVPR